MSNFGITIIGFLIIFLSTALGAAFVFVLKKEVSPKVNTVLLGFAAGVMIAASIWSLLIPAIEQSASYKNLQILPAVIGFLLGGAFLVLLDKVVPHIHLGTSLEEGPKSQINKSIKMFLAVTIHNIPEGLAVGFAFGAAAANGERAAFLSALGVAVGLAIQNLPEGSAVALPLKPALGSKKAFLFGALSGAVEPIAAVVGYFLAATLTVLQPWLLSFTAGAMIFVVVEDLIPDAKLDENSHLGTWAIMVGFVVMMVLDVVLG